MNYRPLALLLLTSCAPKPAPAPEAPVATPAPVVLPDYAKPVLDAMDQSVGACEDFYRYACGGWMKATPLPADKPSWTRSFSQINDNNLVTMRAVLDDAVKNPSDAERGRLAKYYSSCMDEAGTNAAGLTPLAPLLADIDTVKDAKTFMAMSGRLSSVGVSSLARWDIDSDFKNPDLAVLYVMQDGLSLPDRDYYLKSDDSSKALVAALQAKHQASLVALGVPAEKAAKLAADVISFEKAVAEASSPKTDLRDPNKIYNPMDKAAFVKLTPGLGWDGWMANMGGAQIKDVVVATPEAFRRFQTVLGRTDAATLKAYLKVQTVHAFASALDAATYEADFDFYGRKVVGQKEPEVRWKRCVRSTNNALGESLGRVWVESQFPGDSKQVAQAMIHSVEDAFESGLPRVEWMDDTTRARAKEKSDSLVNKIGYPDAWRDYSTMQLDPTSFAANVMAARRFESARVLAKVGKPVDKGEWYMSPPTVNAYYNPTWNEMVFPAGILQPPFFKADYPLAMNYGGIGMVMGHELTHGFDDEGRKFDAAGKLVEWWAPEVSARFEERAACVKEQYDGYAVAPGLNVNGDLTLGENIADLGGLRLAYRAYKNNAVNGKKGEIPGLTDDQLFFVSFAQGWCSVSSPEWEKMLVLSNPHSPAEFRVNGPVSNLPEFHAAFNCAEGTPMNPTRACEVW